VHYFEELNHDVQRRQCVKRPFMDGHELGDNTMQETTFTIPNISCGHCVMSIKNELSDLKGVTAVDGDPDMKAMTVAWEAPATLEIITALLKEINYPAA
jgi:copper chaperone